MGWDGQKAAILDDPRGFQFSILAWLMFAVIGLLLVMASLGFSLVEATVDGMLLRVFMFRQCVDDDCRKRVCTRPRSPLHLLPSAEQHFNHTSFSTQVVIADSKQFAHGSFPPRRDHQ